MGKERILWISGLLLVIVMLLAACGGGETDTVNVGSAGDGNAAAVEEETEDAAPADDTEAGVPPADEEAAGEEEAAAPANDGFPDILVIHPDAFDLEANTASNTYVYIVPLMVADTTDFMLSSFPEKGWEVLGQPTIMGHLATINMHQEGYRLTISMQDNERTETTRVQMMLMEQ